MRSVYMTLKYATIVFALIGLACGAIFQLSYTWGLVSLLTCFGAALSVIAAAICMYVHRINKVNALSLVLNLILFIVIARELQLFG